VLAHVLERFVEHGRTPKPSEVGREQGSERSPLRQVCVLDFKSHQTNVSISHGLTAASRIRIKVGSPTAALPVSGTRSLCAAPRAGPTTRARPSRSWFLPSREGSKERRLSVPGSRRRSLREYAPSI